MAHVEREPGRASAELPSSADKRELSIRNQKLVLQMMEVAPNVIRDPQATMRLLLCFAYVCLWRALGMSPTWPLASIHLCCS